MTDVTLRVLEGADRGHVYDGLPTPITIGREEGNTIQLNDERISRYHVKIQVDQEHVVLTDLESTNGTKVNGDDIQLRILRFGDVINLGRSLLLYGTRKQIAQRLAMQRGEDGLESSGVGSNAGIEEEFSHANDTDLQSTLHIPELPDLPQRMGPAQAAQLAELLEYLHIRIQNLINSVQTKGSSERVTLEICHWQYLLDLQSRLSELLRAIGEPDDPPE